VTAARTVAALALLAAPAWGASLDLTPAQRAEALRVGARSVTAEQFDAEWRVVNGRGESVSVLTPFHRLVIAGRHAAFREDTVKPAEVDRLLREQSKRLVLWAALRGPREEFARFYAPRLLAGDREIAPTFVQNERTAARQGDGTFLARCLYGFPVRDLTGTTRLTLVVADGDGREVARFPIDLAAMR
jgi:hypothetical protein